MAKKPKEYFVHVSEDGTEEVFDTAPTDRKVLKVWIEKRWELTKTYNITLTDDPKGKAMPKSVTPKGEGWQLHTPSEVEPGSTTWRRTRRRR